MVDECKGIEPGRTSIASIRSPAEQKSVCIDFPGGYWWLGGVQIGNSNWYWFSDTSLEMTITPIRNTSYTNWKEWEPNNPKTEHCLMMYGVNESYQWNDARCTETFRALCELRC